MSKRALGSITFLIALGVPSVAGAQEWLKDRRYSEGIGVRAGDLELHPGIAGEIGYDSNYLLRSQKNDPNCINCPPGAPIEATGMLRITPSLSLSTLSARRREGDTQPEPPKLKFRAGLSATYMEFLFNSALTNQRNVAAAADAKLEILPQKPWGGALFANYARTIQPSVVADPNLAFNRDDVGVGGEVVAQPGGGTLDWHFGYQFHGTFFEDVAGTPLNNVTHEAYTKGRWKFRPKSALLYDATLRFLNYTNSPGSLQNSTPIRTRIGLSSLITNRVALLGMVGYGASFYDTSKISTVQQFDSVIAQAEVKFYLTENPGGEQPGAVSLTLSSLSLGYTRDFQNSYLGNFYTNDRGYASLSYFFAGRALLSLTGGVGAIEYPNVLDNTGKTLVNSFTDIRADATLFAEYRFTDTVGINTTLSYMQNFSSTQIPEAALMPGGSPLVFDMNFQRFTAFVGARWFM